MREPARLAIVCPCYNEEAVLEDSNVRLQDLLFRMERENLVDRTSFVLYVDDGSADSTWNIIKGLHEASSMKVKGLRLASNSGHQNAIMAGMMAAKEISDIVVTLDVDLQDDIEAIPEMVRNYYSGSEIVYGVKVSRKADSFFKRLTARMFYGIQSFLGVRCIPEHADFRLLDRKALNMLAGYSESNLYLRALIPLLGLRSSTVDTSIGSRKAGKSKYTLGKMLNLALDGITSFTIRPLRLISLLGILEIAVSLVVGIYAVCRYFTGNTVPGWTSLIVSIWFVGGMLMVALGVIGEYVGKTYMEAKGRPRYHIDTTLL